VALTAAATTITNCVIHNNGQPGGGIGDDSGIIAWHDSAAEGQENVFSHNAIYNNATFGIEVATDYCIVEYNHVYDNGNSEDLCAGIELFGQDGYAQHNIIRYNFVSGQITASTNDGQGINFDEDSADNVAYGNICTGNQGAGIGIFQCHDNAIYNNTLYGNCTNAAIGHLGEIQVRSLAADDIYNNIIKNNVAVATEANTYAIYLDSLSYDQDGLEITNNDWYAAATNWYFWNASGGNNLATWNALTGVGTDLNSDPLFTNAAGGDFTLQAGSPCIEAGVNLGPDYSEQLVAGSTWPDAVETIDWHKTGGVPDIGAYDYRKVIW